MLEQEKLGEKFRRNGAKNSLQELSCEEPGCEEPGDQGRPARPAAMFELMLINDCIFSGVGLDCNSMVRCNTNIAMLRIFWRISGGWGLSLLSAAVMKMVQSLRLNSSAA